MLCGRKYAYLLPEGSFLPFPPKDKEFVFREVEINVVPFAFFDISNCPDAVLTIDLISLLRIILVILRISMMRGGLERVPTCKEYLQVRDEGSQEVSRKAT
jgi:hypothetical protein